MRKVLVIINSSLHALIGTAAFLFVVYALLRGEQFGFIGALILILSIPLMILGIGVFIRPEPMQKAMLGFHLLWVALSVIWSLHLWYILSTNQAGGWGGLAYYLISIGIYSVTILSVITILLFTSVSHVFTSPFRCAKSSIITALPGWVSWKRTLSAVIIVLVGFGIYVVYHN